MRVIQRNLVYVINIHQDFADDCILVQPTLFGQYGKILSISIKKNKSHSKKHYEYSVYSAYITFRNEIEASLCILSVDGSELGGQKLNASYGMTKYCSYYLEDQNCRNENCLFLHKAAVKEDSFSLYDKQSRSFLTRPSKTEIFDLIESFGAEVFCKYQTTVMKALEKIKKDRRHEEQFGPSDSESEEEDKLPSPVGFISEIKLKKPKLAIIRDKPERENQSLKPLPDKAKSSQINKSWHFSSMKNTQEPKSKAAKKSKSNRRREEEKEEAQNFDVQN